MGKEVTVYKALDFLYCKPDNPIYSELIKDGVCVGYNLDNIIHVCNQGQFITAIPDPYRDYVLLAFGKYPVKLFLLEPVGKIKLIRERL